MSNIFRKERYVKVNDNWHPNWYGNHVKLTLCLFSFKDYCYVKLMAWGMDDLGYEICKDHLTFMEALQIYNELKPLYDSIPDNINKEWFINHGFERF